MNITYDEKGVYIKKLFKSREIPYTNIRSVVMANEECTLTTKDGETIVDKKSFFPDYTPLYKGIKKYNIYFKNEDELKEADNVYSLEEMNKKIEQTQTFIREYADKIIHNKLGLEYGMDTKIIDEGEWVSVYFLLLKNGEVVKDISENAKYESADIEPYSIDNYTLAYLLEWDGSGKFGVTEEVEKNELWETCLDSTLKCLFEHYKR